MQKLKDLRLHDLRSLIRNEQGNYWLIFDVKGCRNSINPKAKKRDEIITVGLPKEKLEGFLLSLLKVGDSND